MSAKSNLISGMGVAMSLVHALMAAVREEGCPDADDKLHELVTEQGKSKLKDVARVIVSKAKDNLLCKTAVVPVSENKKFVLAEAVKVSTIGRLSDQFKRLFGNKVEKNVSAVNLAVHRLKRDSADPAIITELSGKPQMPLAYMFELIQKQSQGQQGPLITNGFPNICYAIGNGGDVWAVYCRWDSVGCRWDVCAISVGSPLLWYYGSQVLSCDS